MQAQKLFPKKLIYSLFSNYVKFKQALRIDKKEKTVANRLFLSLGLMMQMQNFYYL